jgi:hypothetical protein
MRKTVLSLAVVALLYPAAGSAQTARAAVELSLGLPVVLPQLVVVSPGVQVVPEVEHEVFLVDGWYWVRHGDGWYRSRSHRGGWVHVGPRYVPARLVKLPPGKYRHWKAARHERAEDRRERREDRRERREDRRERNEDRHDKHEKHGRGHGHH